MKRGNRRGQNTVEYAVLFALVAAAFLTMQTYAKRGLQARVRSGTDALTGISATITGTGTGSGSATFTNTVTQYEPYYQESFGRTYSESVEQEHMGGGEIKKEKVADITVREKGAYQAQKGSVGRSTADGLWETTASP